MQNEGDHVAPVHFFQYISTFKAIFRVFKNDSARVFIYIHPFF